MEGSVETCASPSASPSPPSATNIRLWRPAAQRNLRNQWSKLAVLRQRWSSASSSARSHATAVVNSFLSRSYMDAMELGVLNDMPDIKRKASFKLSKQQELHQRKLLSSYKDMVAVVVQMIDTSTSMRCYSKGSTSNPISQFSSCDENQNDSGDGGGVPVFTFWSISSFEELAEEFAQMFISELTLKRMLVMALVSVSDEKVSEMNGLGWSDEFYPGEFDDLRGCKLLPEGACEPVVSLINLKNSCKSNPSSMQCGNQPDREILQVYLTTWLAEVNIDRSRVDEIITMVGEEMHITLP